MSLITGQYVGNGRYRIIKCIGRGGMGEVYAVEDRKLQGKLRAVKVNRAHAAEGLYLAEEAAMLMRLNHPCLPQIVDYFPPGRDQAELLVIDYIDGVTLQVWKAELNEILEIGVQLCRALAYLHKQQPPIIHRDLKPGNVMVDHSGQVKLIDFGIARHFKAGAGKDTVLIGSPGFASPEQTGAGQSDPRTDIYGLGTLLYFLLSGGTAPTSFADSARQLPPAVPQVIRAMVARMLEKSPERRYPGVAEVEEALQGWLAQNGNNGKRANISPKLTCNNGKKTRRIAVASLSSGAGATTIALALARLIGIQQACAAFEHPLLPPEWYAALRLDESRAASEAADMRYAQCQEGAVKWHARLPWLETGGYKDQADKMEKFHFMYENCGAPVSLLDLSSSWLQPEALRYAMEADDLILVTDPYLSKWTPARLREGKGLQAGRLALEHKRTWWLLNKDMAFRGRKEWLAMLPGEPAASLPQFAPEDMIHQVWHGRGIGSDKSSLASTKRALWPLIEQLFAGS
ncbi:serine/threonine protein kinase [Paenibacillus sp. GCM10027626]|uniref:serine/threonine protein kinase n=1 Tax=Paenibacillus sp. GCM10027626 TaxID=3273411 RepID=UPI003637DC7F